MKTAFMNYMYKMFNAACSVMYSVSQKKTSPTFLAVTRESIVGFS